MTRKEVGEKGGEGLQLFPSAYAVERDEPRVMGNRRKLLWAQFLGKRNRA